MNRRRLLWFAVAGVVAALALWVAVDVSPRLWPGGLEPRAQAVRMGMTRPEVKRVIGRLPNMTSEWQEPEGQEPPVFRRRCSGTTPTTSGCSPKATWTAAGSRYSPTP
jgi:hypothetical protein